MREETRCRNMDYSFRLAARVLLYVPSHRQDNTYHGLWYTSRGALAGTRNIKRKIHYNRQQYHVPTAIMDVHISSCSQNINHASTILNIWKKENVLFNDALNTFSLRLYGVKYIVKDHSDSQRQNPLSPLHGLLFPISSIFQQPYWLHFSRVLINLYSNRS